MINVCNRLTTLTIFNSTTVKLNTSKMYLLPVGGRHVGNYQLQRPDLLSRDSPSWRTILWHSSDLYRELSSTETFRVNNTFTYFFTLFGDPGRNQHHSSVPERKRIRARIKQ